MADDVDFDPSQVYHYRGGREIPENVKASVVRAAIFPSAEEIPDELFADCPRLEEVTFGEGLLKIGDWFFADCRRLESVMFHEDEGLMRIGAWSFHGCWLLRIFRFPSMIREIGVGAFSGCRSLVDVELPQGLASIENATFTHCKSLEAIRIPPSVTRIGSDAFSECINLASIDISEGLVTIENNAFRNCRSLVSLWVPSSVVEIEERAFDGCSSLALLRLHEDLPTLGEFAFRGCPSESFGFARLSERREAIALDAWAKSELEGMLDDAATILVGDSPNAQGCQEIFRRAHGVLTDSLRENTTTLELALWKKKIDEEAERDPRPSRQECRINSGADMNIVIREVLTFIPSPWS